MPRTRKGAGKGSRSQEVKDALAEVKALQKKSRELLKKAGRDVRSVRHDVAQLKKSGLVSHRIDVRKYQPTRYMLRKIEKNRDILSGEVVAIKAPKSLRDQYSKAGIFEQRGSRIIVPKENADQRTRIQRGMVEITRPLKDGEFTRLILPFHPLNLEQLAERFLNDPSLDDMKRPDELFTYRLWGHTAAKNFGFHDAESLGNHIFGKSSISWSLNSKKGREAIRHFELFRFKSKDSHFPAPDDEERTYTPRKRRERPERDWIETRRKERHALRMKNKRARETDKERDERLAAQRLRSARNREKKFLGD